MAMNGLGPLRGFIAAGARAPIAERLVFDQ
jgi:hypothetical protein